MASLTGHPILIACLPVKCIVKLTEPEKKTLQQLSRNLHSARRGHNLARISSLVRRAEGGLRVAENTAQLTLQFRERNVEDLNPLSATDQPVAFTGAEPSPHPFGAAPRALTLISIHSA